MSRTIKIFPTPFELAEDFARELTGMILESAKQKNHFTLALSGGKTPELLFSVIGDHFSKSAPWETVHFFWVDERCVPPEDNESNYGMAKRSMLDRLKIPEGNVHRIRGEKDPGMEAERYSNEIRKYTRILNGLPSFDMIMLGLGEDGHTASIFPGQEYLLDSENLCEKTFHPVTGQTRLTLSGTTIRNASRIAFIATGKKKALVIGEILNNSAAAEQYPASFIKPFEGDIQWFIDKEAGLNLKQK